MEIKTFLNPPIKTVQSIMFFQFRFFGWSKKDMVLHDEKYGSEPFGYVVGYEKNEMVGVINLIKRELNYRGKTILVGGIGGVTVSHKHRGKGIGTKLLEEAMEELKRQKCDIAFLSTDISKHSTLYTRIGFVPINREHKVTGASGKEYPGYGGMVAPILSSDVFEAVLKSTEVFDIQGQDW
jgi:predicted N-acetyltransferase YhbS